MLVLVATSAFVPQESVVPPAPREALPRPVANAPLAAARFLLRMPGTAVSESTKATPR